MAGGGDWERTLERWLEPFLGRLGHPARRRMCPLYVAGLIGPGDRKSLQPMAARLAPADYDQLHHFIAVGPWDDQPLALELLAQADRLVGGPDAVLTRRRGPKPASPVPNVPATAAKDMLARSRWRTITWRQGTKGPLRAAFAAMRVRVADGPAVRMHGRNNQHLPGEEVWLVGERRSSGERRTAGARKYDLSNLPPAPGLKLKEVLGLDHFEGRSWRGLHRHALMSLIAFCFLQHQRLQAAKWGEKVERTAAPAEPASDQASLSSALRRCDGPTMSHLPSPVPPQLAT